MSILFFFFFLVMVLAKLALHIHRWGNLTVFGLLFHCLFIRTPAVWGFTCCVHNGFRIYDFYG